MVNEPFEIEVPVIDASCFTVAEQVVESIRVELARNDPREDLWDIDSSKLKVVGILIEDNSNPLGKGRVELAKLLVQLG
jgi:hypothetical protein